MQQKRPRYWRGQGNADGAKKHGKIGSSNGDNDEGLGESWVRVALELRDDLAVKCVFSLGCLDYRGWLLM